MQKHKQHHHVSAPPVHIAEHHGKRGRILPVLHDLIRPIFRRNIIEYEDNTGKSELVEIAPSPNV